MEGEDDDIGLGFTAEECAELQKLLRTRMEQMRPGKKLHWVIVAVVVDPDPNSETDDMTVFGAVGDLPVASALLARGLASTLTGTPTIHNPHSWKGKHN